jgi:hypothetical protein
MIAETPSMRMGAHIREHHRGRIVAADAALDRHLMEQFGEMLSTEEH